jgi:HYR domain/Secretion system C-terminal sorting domain
MKKVYYLFSTLAMCALLFSYAPASEAGKTGSNGAPGESTCASCHGAAAGGSATLTSDIPLTGFVPGATYNMVLTVSQAGQPLFGMGLESLSATNTQSGTLTAGTGTQVQVKATRQNLIHTFNGGLSANSKAFSFKWTAPATAAGNVTFYYAGLAANGNGVEDSGDNTYVGTKTVSPQTAVATVLTLNCPTDIAVTAAAGATTAVANYTAPVGTSTCTTGTVTTSKSSGLASGAAFPIGTNAVCYTATDGCGNTKNCCFNVVVTAPAASVITMNCPANITVAAAAGATTAVANYTAPVGTSTCITGTVTTSKSSGLASGAAFPIGTNAVCYTATDGCGTTKNCCFNVVVTSAAATVLTLNCPADQSIIAAIGATTAIVTYIDPIATSTCATGTVTTRKISGLASGSAFPIGTSLVCYSATDGCGNIKNCCMSVIVSAGGTNIVCNNIRFQDEDKSIKIFNLPRGSTFSVGIKVTNTTTNAVVLQCTNNCAINKGTVKIKNLPRGSTYLVQVDIKQNGVLLCQKSATLGIYEDEDEEGHDLRGSTNSSIDNTLNKETAAELEDMVVLYAQPAGITKAPKTFGLFPNPAANAVTIDMVSFKGQAVNVLIVNQLGQVVKTQFVQEATKAPVSVSIENIPDGFYTVTLLSNGERKANKLVVKNDR